MPATSGIGDISIAGKARSYDTGLSRHSGMTTQIKSSAPFAFLRQAGFFYLYPPPRFVPCETGFFASVF